MGAGGIAAPHVTAWQALGAEVTVHSRRPPTEFAARHGIPLADSLESLVAASDVVDICTPTPTHDAIVRAAVAARRQVVCEKPLARTADQAQALVDLAADAGVLLFPAHVVRYFPAYRDLHERLAVGALGQVRSASFSRRVAAPPDESWFHDLELSGGVVLDLMLHDLDQALWQFGSVLTVAAEALRADGRAVRATLTHETGVETVVEGEWGPPGTTFATSYAVHGSVAASEHRSTDDAPGAGDPYLAQLRDVVDHLETGRPPRVSPADGVAAVALAERVLEVLQ